MPQLIFPGKKPKVLAPVHPNAGVTVAYQKRLDALLTRMHNSLVYWLRAAYRANTPALAMDASISELVAAMRRLARQWQDRFNRGAEELARYFAQSASKRSDAALARILRDAGFSVKFKQTPAWVEIKTATVSANVSLIKSIASEHLTAVEGIVMRAVQEGRDQQGLVAQLQEQFGVTKRRAALIARDQNNKATAAITRCRQQELGITKAVWVHSHAGREPRPKHVAFAAGRLGGPVYDIAKGAPIGDKGEFVLPGFEINCRCTSRPIIPGLVD